MRLLPGITNGEWLPGKSQIIYSWMVLMNLME